MRGLAITILLLVLAGSAMGHRGWQPMYEMEEGTFEELVEYRERTGVNVMPWVQSEEEYERMREWRNQWRYVGHCGW